MQRDRSTGVHRHEVDRLVVAWERERPDLDVAPLQVLSRISRLARHLDLARSAAFAERGLELWEFDVLSALRRSGPPYLLSPGQLVDQTLVTSGTMTNRIDRLTTRGFVERSPDPNDRRGVIVALTRRVGRPSTRPSPTCCTGSASCWPGSRAHRSVLASLLRELLEPFDA